MDQPGQVTVSVGAGAVTDAAGNSSADVVEGDNTVYYTSGASTLIVDTDGAASDTNFPASCSDPTPTAYTTIQAAIDAASNGNTIKVCPGVYEELVDVNKSVTLQGPNAGVNPNTTSPTDATSAIIRIPDSTTPDPTWNTGNVLVNISAKDVTIDGFTLDGDNPDVQSGIELNGADVDAGWGVLEYGLQDPHFALSNSFIRNVGEMGTYVSGGDGSNRTGSITNNKFDNIPGVGTYGGGIHTRDNAWTNITGNHLTRVNFGIVVENMSADSADPTISIANNVVSARGLGIRTNSAYSITGTTLTVTNNDISSYVDNSAGAMATTSWRGVRIESWQTDVPLTVENNTIRPDKTALQTAGYTRIDGIWITNTSTNSALIAIKANTISNTLRGISQTTPATPSVTCNAIYGNDVGIYVGHDIQFGGTTESYATGGISMSENSIVGNGLGVQNDQSPGIPPVLTVPATVVDQNFWGSTDGPGPIGTGLGDGRSTFTTEANPLPGRSGCAPAIVFPDVTIDQASGQADPANASPVHFTVTFSQVVTGLDATKIRLSGTAGATTATVVSGSGAGPYDVEVSGMTGQGTIIADLYAGAGFTASGVPSVASNFVSTDNTVTYDNVAPTVVSITRGGGSTPTNAASVTFDVTFSESVNNVDTGDFTLSPTVTGASISSVIGSGANYTVTVNTGTGDGPLGLNINTSDIADPATNTLGNLPFSTGETYTIDKTGPTTIVAPAADPDNASPVDFTVNFGEATTGFDAADVTIGGTANPTHFTISGPGPYTVSVTGMNQSGTVTVSVAAGAAADALGNLSSGPVGSSAQFNQQSTPSVSSTTAPNGWFYWQDNGDTLISSHDYVFGPAGGPLPVGSARLQNGASDLKGLFTFQYRNTRLDAITTLKYSTYVPTGTSAAPSLQIGVDFTGVDSPAPAYQGRLVYAPSGVVNDTWQTWNLDLSTAKFYYSSATYSPSGDGCKFSEGTGCTLATILAAHPNARVMPIADPSYPDPNNTWGVVGFRTQNNETAYVDDFVIGVNSSNTVVNFEPAGTTVVTPADASWFTWDDTSDLLCDNDYVFGPLGGPLPVGSARLLSSTCSNATATSDRKGLFTKAFKGTKISEITTLKYSTYVPAASGTNVPSFQIGVDFTGIANAGYQGRLVYVPTGIVNDTWQTWDLLADPNAKFYYSSNTYSPNDGLNCYISAGVGCTLSQILAAHPNLRVMPDNSPTPGLDGDTWGVLGVRTEAGSNANVDNIIVGVNSANTVVDFEPAGVVVSTPVSPKGWFSWDDTTEVPCDSEYVSGPVGGPLPVGSAHLSSSTCSGAVSSTDRKGFFTKAFQGARLDQITALKYSSYVPAGTGTPSFQVGVDFTGAANPGYQGRLVYVPTGVTNDTWQTWDLKDPNAKFYYSSGTYSPNGDGCLMNQGSGCTLAMILAAHPNIRIMPNDDPNPNAPDTWGVLGIRMDANANANVDNIIVGVNGAVTTFDFEAAPPTISIAGSPGNATEGSNVSFTVTLTGDTPARTVPVAALLNTTDGTATGSGTDYTSAVNQVVTFAPGVSSQTVTVSTATDNIAEGDETFTATLSNAVNAGIGTASATGTINDGAGWIAIGGHVMAYNNGGSQTGIAGVTVTLTGTSNASPISATTTTDGSGNYNFNTGISKTGQYSIAPTPVGGYVFDPESKYFINPAATINNANFVGYNNDNPRHMTIGNVTQSQVGANVVVPVTFNALGTEQGGSFVLNFDTTKLHYVSSSAPLGTNLVVSAGPGPKTVSFSKLGPPPYTGSVTLNFTFSATPGNALSTPVTFANPKRISNTQGVGVPAVWTDGSVIFAQGNEGDISDGTTGGFTDGFVDASDVSRIVSLIVGDATPNPNVNEFQRADAGPYLPSRGDGCIDALDLTAILLYSVGDLPTTPAAGPVAPPCGSPLQAKDAANRTTGGTVVRFVGSRAAPGGNIDVQVELSAQGIENGTTFTLNYNSTVLDEFPTITLGSEVPNGAFFFTNSMSHPGKTAVTFSLQSGQTMPVGDTVILNFQYHVKSSAAVGTYPVVFTSDLARQRVSNIQAQSVPATWEDGVVEIMLAPTAALSSVGGQVRTADGRGIGNTIVTLTGTDGSVRRALTNQMGYYRIDEVPTGATYVIGATSKRYAFDTRVITVGDNITDADLTPRE